MSLSITKRTPLLVDAAPGIGICPAPRTANMVLVVTMTVKAPATSCTFSGVKMHRGDSTADSDQNSVVQELSFLALLFVDLGSTLIFGIIHSTVWIRDAARKFGS